MSNNQPPARGRGRPKGTPNKTTTVVKSALLAVHEKRGGVKAMLEWSNENPTEFYKLLGKLLPKEVELAGKDGGPIGVTVKFGGKEIPL